VAAQDQALLSSFAAIGAAARGATEPGR